MIVRIRCIYPGTDFEPTEVEFEPGAGLGLTPTVVLSRILELVATRVYVELPAAGESPIPLWTATIRDIEIEGQW